MNEKELLEEAILIIKGFNKFGPPYIGNEFLKKVDKYSAQKEAADYTNPKFGPWLKKKVSIPYNQFPPSFPPQDAPITEAKSNTDQIIEAIYDVSENIIQAINNK